MIQVNNKLVMIIWEDSQLGFQGWKLINEQPKNRPVYISVGFLTHDDDKMKVLFPHVKNTDDQDDLSGSGDILIPNSAIIEIIELKTNPQTENK